ncbi:MAG: glycosyltransferase [Deltaproteobacteria bacterium]|nr:glycosyltransferase [Deltaproteobacteria bacterium]
MIAVVIPCRDEEVAIAGVVRDFRAALPTARIHVYDNVSTDRTAEAAAVAGALVGSEPERGKGNVVRRMFGDIDADIFVLVDGDGTYPADRAPEMIARLIDGRLDMVSGARVTDRKAAYRPGHRFGNRVITFMVGLIFGRKFSDILSGYRVLSRRFVKSFPALSEGFEIETEIAVHALEMRLPCAEVEVPYFERPHGSRSKLKTIRDGISIVKTIFALIKGERPLEVFFVVFVLFELAAVGLAWPLLAEYLETGLVPRIPTAVLSTGLALLGFLSLACSLILDTVTLGRREIKRLHYLGLPGLPVRQGGRQDGRRQADQKDTERNARGPGDDD